MYSLDNTVFFRQLRMRNSVNSTQYAGILLSVSAEIGSFLQYIKKTFPDYPDHGIGHSCRILDNIARILGEQIEHLTDTEMLCFILAALFHDTGMSLVGFSSKEEMRKKHEINSSVVIEEYFNSKLSLLARKDRIKSVVKYVCRAHGLELREMYQSTTFNKVDTINGDDVRYSVLAVLLRIGDLLDLDEERVDWLALKVFPNVFSETAKNHNIRHLHVLTYHCGHDALNVEVEAKNISQYRIWKEWFGYLENDILYANTNLKFTSFSFPALSYSIKKDEEADFDVEEIHFELDETGSLWSIISQSIYTNQFDFIREIVQNAIDASLAGVYSDDGIVLKYPSPRGWYVPSKYNKVYVCYSRNNGILNVIDFGIGMDSEGLRRFLFKVSSTGYKELNKRGFLFPSIANYGIGFVSCLINANQIDIYTRNVHSSQMNKVLLETGSNQAFIERKSADGYNGTTISIRLKHKYSSEEIRQYLFSTFRFPSVGIEYVDVDALLYNHRILYGQDGMMEFWEKPYKIHDQTFEVQKRREEVLQVIKNRIDSLLDVERVADALIQWMHANSAYSQKYTDKDKFLHFSKKVSIIQSIVTKKQLRLELPFSDFAISEKGLFTSMDEYLYRMEKLLDDTRNEIKKAEIEKQEYPAFSYSISSPKVSLSGEWRYFVVKLNDQLEITGIEKYFDPVDLSTETGIVVMQHDFHDYDLGIEYTAINGFLFRKGSVCTRIISMDGQHRVFRDSVRRERFTVGTFDCSSDIYNSLQGAFCASMENVEEEMYFAQSPSGDLVPGIEFAPSCSTIEIVDNEVILSKDVDITENLRQDNAVHTRRFNVISQAGMMLRNGSADLSVVDEFEQVGGFKTVYCQDGIAIPFEIECLFPFGLFKTWINTTHRARIALNVTRHEPSRLSSDIDMWLENVGMSIQKNIFKEVVGLLSQLNIDCDLSEVQGSLGSERAGDYFEKQCRKNFVRLLDNRRFD